MVDLKVLESVGTDNAALKELFLAEPPGEQVPRGAERDEQQKRYDQKKRICDQISSRITDGITFALSNYHFFSAIDLAWSTSVVTKATIPLLLYAQKKIDVAECASRLGALSCADEFVKKDKSGKAIEIDLPKFTETSVNLMRSMVTRRAAAQSNKFGNLWPYFKYEPRSTSEVGRLRGDLMSQRADIAADQYGWRHHDNQIYRDALGYGHQVDFVRASWEKDIHWAEKEGGGVRDVVSREGLVFVSPHPTRIFWDRSHPLSAINNDLGMAWIGFWDVARYGDIKGNPKYWNRKAITYGESYTDLWSTYGAYFTQYYTNIKIPTENKIPPDLAAANDRSRSVGYYSDTDDDSAIMNTNLYMKVVPKEWGCGKYPYPVWVRLVVAGFDSVVFAEWLPDTPAAYCGVGQKDDLLLSPGFGHELLSYQDQMSNLLSYLLLALRADNYKVLVLDIDTLTAEQLAEFRRQARGGSFESETHILEVSRAKLREMNLDVENVVQLVETKSSAQITIIFQAMLSVLSIVERVFALSPQEQGQPAPREISATETNMLAATTESVYNSISDSIDEFRDAKKRIFYHHLMNFAEERFELPVKERYSDEAIRKAGMTIDEQEFERSPNGLVRGKIIGKIDQLAYEYIFSSRDGGERTSNVQAAEKLSEVLKSVLSIPTVQESMTQGQLIGLINEFCRMAGAFDFKIESTNPDEPVSPSAEEQLKMILEKITKAIEGQGKALQNLDEQVAPLIQLTPLLYQMLSPNAGAQPYAPAPALPQMPGP